MKKKIVIVGGGHAGGRVAQALVRDDDSLDVTIIGREPHPPYERPPLSKGILLGTATLDDCLIWRPGDPAWERVRTRLGISAKAIDRARSCVVLTGGETIAYDTLVLAMGSRLRRFSVRGSEIDGVHELRTVDDAVSMAEHFRRGKRLLVVGGGFVGLEIAAASVTAGLETTIIEASDRLLARIVPRPIGDALAHRHQSEGATLRFGCMVEEFIANDRGALRAAKLSSGETVRCDIAVVGVGVSADVALARAAGLDVDVGIVTDERLMTSDPKIFACGDVASCWHPVFERRVRVEAWQNAEEQSRIVAAAIRGDDARHRAVPFFWSDQYDLSLQIIGIPHFGSSVAMRDLDEGARILFHLDALGRLVAATALGPAGKIGRTIRRARGLIARQATPDLSAQRDLEGLLPT